MCGIAGIHNIREPRSISLDILKRMIGTLYYRGPDKSGIYIDDWVGLGHARLSIIDLSSGTQPIHNEEKNLWIVCNGEIFNYPELRQDLLKKGHRFYTASDTEVLLHLYEEKGPSCLDDLNGQFAFAIWNSKDRELFLARDRIGIRPLHYTVLGDTIIFASEIKSIFASEIVEREIDPIALDQIFTFWTTLPGRTAFKGIQELLPGHYMKISHGQITITKYWDIPYCQEEEKLDWTSDEISEKIQELLYDAIRIRLRADVPVGAYLSGGLDSSGVTTLIAKKFNNKVRTFGIRFEEEDFDEGNYQRQMVSFLNVDHRDIWVTNEKIRASFPEVIWHCEKPLLRTAPVPLFLLSNLVRQSGLKVVLTGEGGDEVFGGYNIFREDKVRRFWARQPDSKFRFLIIRRLYPYIFKNPRLGNTLKHFFAQGLEKTDDPLYSHLIRWENTSRIKFLFSDYLKSAIGSYDGYEELKQSLPESYNKMDYLSKAQYLEISLFMSNYLLSSQGDRVAMAHSVEIRVPYLDHRIIEFMARVPSKLKIRGLNEKYILKKSFKDILPENIINRSKQPFRAPISQSLLDEKNQEMLLDQSRLAGLENNQFFDLHGMRSLLKKFKTTGYSNEIDNMALAGILSTHIVYDQFISNFTNHPAKRDCAVSPRLFVDQRTVSESGSTHVSY